MVEYTKSGNFYYKVLADGTKSRITKDEYAKKTKTAAKKSPRKSSTKRKSPRKSSTKRHSPRKGKKSPSKRKPRKLAPWKPRETSPRSVQFKDDPQYTKCREYLQAKIADNMKKLEQDLLMTYEEKQAKREKGERWLQNRRQAIAVSYGQTRADKPECDKYYKRPEDSPSKSKSARK